MNYFDGIKVNDRVWDFQYGWGKVIDILKDNLNFPIIVHFENGERESFDYNGKPFRNSNQTLFWDEIKFEIPEKPKIELKENKYIIEPTLNEIQSECESKAMRLGFGRNDKETAEKALKQIKRFVRLLALRDQECPDSRGYEFIYGYEQFVIFKNTNKIYSIKPTKHIYSPTDIYFKTEKDAKKICDILNSGRFDLEGE